MDLTFERVRHNGHLIVSTIHNNQYVKRVYIGYSKKEAAALFREDIKKNDAKIFRKSKTPQTG